MVTCVRRWRRGKDRVRAVVLLELGRGWKSFEQH